MNTKTNNIVNLAERRAKAQSRKQEPVPITYNLKVTHLPDEMTFGIYGLTDNDKTRSVIEDDLVAVLQELRRQR